MPECDLSFSILCWFVIYHSEVSSSSNQTSSLSEEPGESWQEVHRQGQLKHAKTNPILDSISNFMNECHSKQKLHRYKFDIDTLEFWRTIKGRYPMIERAALKILGIPATSAFVERCFSKTGYIHRQHRRRLNSANSERLFFLRCNSELFEA